MLKCFYIGLNNNSDDYIFKGHKDMCIIWEADIVDSKRILQNVVLKIFVVSYYLKMILKSP